MTPHILVTGFNSFAGRSVNAAATVAQALQSQRVADHFINTVLLKVNWRSVEKFAQHTLPLTTAHCVVALGEADRPHISIETKATADCSGADVDGFEPPRFEPPHRHDHQSELRRNNERTLVNSGLDSTRITALTKLCESTPQHDLSSRLQTAPSTRTIETPIKHSDDAGDYLCNRLFYLGLAYSPVPFVFIHLPIQGETANETYLRNTLPAVRQIIREFAQPSENDESMLSLSEGAQAAD